MTENLTQAQRIVGSKSKKREKDDFYPTPPAATEALLSVEKFSGAIWEPACGDGAISEVLKRHGHDVYSTDLVFRGYGTSGIDFLIGYHSHVANIITNPPYKLAVPFIEKSLACTTEKTAMLLRLNFLEGKARRKMFESTPLARIHVFSERVQFARDGKDIGRGGGGLIAFAWFVWEHGYSGKPTVDWI